MKIAICPGSFDPITLGHLDIIKRASNLFDEVIVLVMSNGAKKNSLFTVEERMKLIERSITDSNIKVDTYDGLLVDYAKEKGAIAIVKGLRAMSDFDYEFQQALTNRSLNPEIQTIFLTTDAKHMFLSSSAVKEVCHLGGNIDLFVPSCIKDDIYKRCKGE